MASKFSLALILGLASVRFLTSFAGARHGEEIGAMELLEESIEAIDSASGTCVADDFSSEDGEVLQTLSSRAFTVIEIENFSQRKVSHYEFVLVSDASGATLTARVAAIDGKCTEYSFGKVVE